MTKKENQQAKINTYIIAFFAFLIVIFVAFMLTRYQTSSYQEEEPKAGDVQHTSESVHSEEIIVTKFAELTPEKAKLLKDTSGELYLGNKYAPVLMIEYASLSCPHCAHFHSDVLEKLLPKYIETGKLKYVFRDFPLNKQAFDAAKLTHCAPDDKYYGFVKALFKSQENWAFSKDYTEILKSIAKLGGIPAEAFEECMNNKEIEDKILDVQKEAVDILEVKSTPTIFINGHHYKGGNDYGKVAKFIDGLLKGE